MDQRVAFIADWLRDEWTMTELAERYGISRKRRTNGSTATTPIPSMAWRSDRGRRRCTGERWDDVREAVVRCAAGIRAGDRRNFGRSARAGAAAAWPAASTMGDLLRREGLGRRADAPRYVVPLTQPLAAAPPNDVWTADFKGWFRTGGWDTLQSPDDPGRV